MTGGGLIPVAALVAACVALLTLWVNGRRAERNRRREIYASALTATFAYREFAYAVPRRRHDARSEERVRLSEAMREIQRDLTRYEKLLDFERSKPVAAAYRALVAKTRTIAGGHIRRAWERPPIMRDRDVNVHEALDFSPIDPATENFAQAVRRDLRWWNVWPQRQKKST